MNCEMRPVDKHVFFSLADRKYQGKFKAKKTSSDPFVLHYSEKIYGSFQIN